MEIFTCINVYTGFYRSNVVIRMNVLTIRNENFAKFHPFVGEKFQNRRKTNTKLDTFTIDWRQCVFKKKKNP